MKKIYILILITYLFSNGVSAQQLPLYSQYMFNPYLTNSAVCGTNDYSILLLNYRDQWSGFGNGSVNMIQDGVDPAPKTYSLSFDKGLSNHSSIGFYVGQDQTLAVKSLSLQATYAYRFKFSENLNLSLAISPVFNSITLNNGELWAYEEDIIWDDATIEKGSNIDFNFGAYLYNDRFDFGFSIANLAETEYTSIGNNILGNDPQYYSNGVDTINRRIQHLFLHSSYDFQFDWAHSLSIVPSFLLKSTWVTKPQLDLNIKFIYWDYFWIGTSYRTSDNVIVPMLGVNSENIFIGYSYDISNSALSSFHNGTHAISLGIYFNGNNQNKYVRKRNRFSEIRQNKPGGWLYWYRKSKWW